MKIYRLLIIIFLLPFQVSGKDYKVDEIPNPKEAGDYFVSNPDNILSSAEQDSLEFLLRELKDSTGFEMAVVAVNSIGDQVPKDFANKLFNTWGIGVKGKDNGILMLVVLGQRRVEIETGYGTETVLPDVVCSRILDEEVVPYFKSEIYGSGIIAGVSAISLHIKSPEAFSNFETYSNYADTNDAEFEAIMREITEEEIINLQIVSFIILLFYYVMLFFDFRSKKRKKLFSFNHHQAIGNYQDVMPVSIGWWLLVYVLMPPLLLLYPLSINYDNYSDSTIPFFILIIYIFAGFAVLDRRRRLNKFISNRNHSAYQKYIALTLSNNKWIWVTLLLPFHLVLYWVWYNFVKKALRNTPVPCRSCQNNMRKLDELKDNEKLSKAQILEEELKSIDYDVWACNDCNQYEVLKYVNHWSSYSECVKCKAKAYHLNSKKTIQEPTYTSSGHGIKTYLCKNCNHKKEERYTIAKLERSSSGSSSGGSSWSSSGGGSSGGSWGGGRSGGGGAGKSW